MQSYEAHNSMTTEIAIMNKDAVALAADSAASISRDREVKKIYNANKLFMLSKKKPIGIMFYNNTELNFVPWETIIKIYRDMPQKKFDTLVEYAEDFISFLNNKNNPFYNQMFPKRDQEALFSILVGMEFKEIAEKIDEKIKSITEKESEITETKIIELVGSIIKEKYNESEKTKTLNTILEEYNQELIQKYEFIIIKRKEEVFKEFPISEEALAHLKKISCNVVTKDHFFLHTGIVIAGFGDKDIFPSLVSYVTDFIFNDSLKYKKDQQIVIDHLQGTRLLTFAQDEPIDAFLFGVHPDYNVKLNSALSDLIINEIPEKLLSQIDKLSPEEKASCKGKMKSIGKETYDNFFKTMIKQSVDHFAQISQIIQYLPKEELGIMAESLVNLVSFRKRMSLEAETVGGPCDVAVISKGDGFIWVKRKHYFRKELNPQFFKNYYESWGEKED